MSPPALEGLTESEAAARLTAYGPNALPTAREQSWLRHASEVLREPMLLLLLGAGALYLLLGDRLEAAALLVLACFAVLLNVVQQVRAGRAIEKLGELARPQAAIVRGGIQRRIAAADIVPGDILVIGEGERIAADGWVVSGGGLMVDESLLTGEPVPVRKAISRGPAGDPPPQPGGDDLSYGFSGTMVVAGSGLIRVAATGPQAALGRIGQALTTITTEAPRLTVETRALVRIAALAGLGASALATVLFGLLRGGWVDAVLSGIALSMSLLPEELPVVLALFLTMGAMRLARCRVLARHGSAIESLGAATVLCTDKTGTLTLNRMAIAQLRLPDGSVHRLDREDSAPLPAAFVELAGLGLLACAERPVDPMEMAFHDLSDRDGNAGVAWRQRRGWALDHRYPLERDLLAVSHVWKGNQTERVIAAKGAPEAIAELCGLPPEERAAMEVEVEAMARSGLRVLGVAEAGWPGGALPENQRAFAYGFRGLIGLADPVRPGVPEAVATLQAAGIRVAMITGDYPATARAIALQAGLAESGVMTGSELARLGDAELVARVASVSVFARVIAEQKVRIVEALKARGDVTAMIGDGVNDAPSLKAAHIGVAMGRRGTDVAREAAAIVLLDDDFAAIPAAVALGRRIFDNLRKASGFIVAVHVPIAALALAPLILGWPIVLEPLHIAVLELIIDPVCALAFEAEREEPGTMRRPPRNPREGLLPRRSWTASLAQGALAAATVLGVGAWAHADPMLNAAAARAATFASLLVAVLLLIAAHRSTGASPLRGLLRPNGPLLVIGACAATTFAAALMVPALRQAFGFAPMPPASLAVAAGAATALAMALATLKHACARLVRRGSPA